MNLWLLVSKPEPKCAQADVNMQPLVPFTSSSRVAVEEVFETLSDWCRFAANPDGFKAHCLLNSVM